jgi:hypothetical protein
MLGPTRPLPCVGAPVRIQHFGGEAETGVVVSIAAEGRHLVVRGADGELYEFVLNRANARFVSAASAHGPRLELIS